MGMSSDSSRGGSISLEGSVFGDGGNSPAVSTTAATSNPEKSVESSTKMVSSAYKLAPCLCSLILDSAGELRIVLLNVLFENERIGISEASK
jgi:hypothetical protein